MSQHGWADAPGAVREQVEHLSAGLADVLEENLVGVYLHGSLALGCYNPRRSDIDLVALTKRRTTEEERRRLAPVLLEFSGSWSAGPPYPIEIHFLGEGDVRPWRYPTPFDLHYSERYREPFEAGRYELQQTEDHDLAAHVTVLRSAGVVLRGPPPASVFPAVPERDYVDALLRDLRWSREEGEVLYTVLSPARIWASLAELTVHSKASGGVWARKRLPQEFRPLVDRALDVYRGASEDEDFPADELRRYADYVESQIALLLR